MISRFTKTCSILIFLILYMNSSWVLATVETSVQKTLKTDAVPIDVTVSPDGRSTFVLTDEGSVLRLETGRHRHHLSWVAECCALGSRSHR